MFPAQGAQGSQGLKLQTWALGAKKQSNHEHGGLIALIMGAHLAHALD